MMWALLSLCLVMQGDDATKDKVRQLIARLENDKETEAWLAAVELGDIGSSARDALPALRKKLEAPSSMDRAYAATALLLIDQAETAKAFPVLIAVFKDDKEALTQLGLIARIGQRFRPATQEGVEGLLQLAAVNRGSGWVIADQALRRIEPSSKAALAGLAAGLKHRSPAGRILAAYFLAKHDSTRRAEAVAVLREALSTDRVALQLNAARALQEIDPKSEKEVLETLAAGLKHPRAAERSALALHLLERDAARAATTTPILLDILKDDDETASREVLLGLGLVLERQPTRFAPTLPLFEQVLRGDNVELRVEAMRQLAGLGPLAQAAERLVRKSAAEANPELAATALETLMRLRPENAADRVPDFLTAVEKRDRTANGIKEFLKRFETLRKQQEARANEPWIEGLTKVLEESDREGREGWSREELLRLHAIVEVGALGAKGAKAVPALAKLLPDRDVKPLLRAQAALALGRLGKASRGVVPALNRAARDEKEAPDVRAAAKAALTLIDRDKDS